MIICCLILVRVDYEQESQCRYENKINQVGNITSFANESITNDIFFILAGLKVKIHMN